MVNEIVSAALALLRLKWLVGGLDVPAFALIASGFLLAFTFGIWLWLRVRVFRDRRRHQSAVRLLKGIRDSHPATPREGLPGAAYEDIRRVFEKSKTLKDCWEDFDSRILVRRSRSGGEDQRWASESAEAAFGETAVIDAHLNRTFYSAIPGIVTGIGLSVTFLAILVALLDVRLVENRVQGLDQLIQGLSGKFVSSIAALLAATLYLFSERSLFHRLDRSRRQLVRGLDKLIPRLSPGHLLVDLQGDAHEQALASRHFSADLATKVSTGFHEGLRPTLERMIETIDGLDRSIRAAEAANQESMRGSLENLLQDLSRRLTESIDGMATQFREQLSGSALRQLDRVVESLAATSSVVEKMNEQSTTSQAALERLIDQARRSTEEQLTTGREQVDAITSAIYQMMDRMSQTTDASVGRMASDLRALLDDLARHSRESAEEQRTAGRKHAEELAGILREIMANVRESTAASVSELIASLGQSVQGFTAQGAAMAQRMEALVEQVKASTEEQRSLGARHVEDLGQRFEQLMARVARSTADSVDDVAGRLAHAISELSAQMQEATGSSMVQMTREVQEMLEALARHARESAEAERARGRKIAEDLGGVSEDLMARLQGTTATSVERVGSSLAEAAERFKAEAAEMADLMKTSLLESGTKVIGAADRVVDRVETWSTQSHSQLARVFGQQESQLGRIEEVRKTLDDLLHRFPHAIEQHGRLASELVRVAALVKEAAETAAQAAALMREAQPSFQQVSVAAASQVRDLAAANGQQQETWMRIEASMGRYQVVFGEVEAKAGAIIGQINQGLRDYMEASRDGFDQLVRISDEHLKNAVSRLGQSVGELDDHLQDLNEALDRIPKQPVRG
ncbi:MAG: hypothetical protein HYV63_30970 [Candidatus Schekmanbacteria bacterium]|nr:hypothetical protein [Candidatus Schekmanbacteria bacterium]